jgi:hypothetical protein
MVKWPVLVLEIAVAAALVAGGLYWHSRRAPSAYDAGCTTIVCDGQKADENEPDVTAPVTPAPQTGTMESNTAANPTEAAPMPPKVTVSRTPTRHRAHPRATIRTRSRAGKPTHKADDPFCSQMPAIAYSLSREQIIEAARDRGYDQQQIDRALACLGK